jgi:fructokinase
VITVVGEALIKLVPAQTTGVLRALPGGGALNTAVRAARLGYPTTLMARLSRDPFGQMLRRHASSNGVDLSAAPEADEPTTISLASAGGHPGSEDSLYHQGTASWLWSSDELTWIPADTAVLHLDSLSCCVPPGSARVLRAAVRERRRGAAVCLNVAAVPTLLGSPARARLLMDRPMRSADVVRARVQDIAWLYPGRSIEAVAKDWLSAGPRLVVITRGSEGVVAAMDSGPVVHRAVRPSVRPPVTDPDGFDTAFTAALLGQIHRGGIEVPNAASLVTLLDAAVASACDQPPMVC